MRRKFKFLWLAFLPVFPPLSLLALSGLGSWNQLPRQWKAVLLIFLVTQVLAACFTPDLALSVILALLRSVFIIGLILMGTQLRSSQALRPALLGYSVVAVTAFLITLKSYPGHSFAERLIHPYYTNVSLGVAGMIGILLALTWRGGALTWRLMGGGLCLGMFLWSGSRGPLIALIAGLFGIALTSLKSHWRTLLIGGLIASVVIAAVQRLLPGNILGRFLENTLNGRGAYWADALDTAQAHPWGGAGPYQLGPYLSTQFSQSSCHLWLNNQQYGFEQCPALLDQFRGAWLIAHNTAFHLLGETGIIGTTGWLALMGALALAAWRSRDPLVNGLTWAIAAMGLVDNPTLVPNLGHAELYWLAGGIGLASVLKHDPLLRADGTGTSPLVSTAPLVACVLLAYWTLPLWLDRIRPTSAVELPVLRSMAVPDQLKAGENVNLFLDVDVPKASAFELTAKVCSSVSQTGCQALFNRSLEPGQRGWVMIGMKGLAPGNYTLHLLLREHQPALRVERPAAELTRELHVE